MAGLIITLFIMAGSWRMFQKCGRQGWEAIIPLYNVYVICDLLYGQGWKILLYLIPFYNIYFTFKVNIDMARGFNQGAGFGVGLTFLPMVFVPILGFGNMTWGDGSEATVADDFISRGLDQLSGKMNGSDNQAQSAPVQEPVRPAAEPAQKSAQEAEKGKVTLKKEPEHSPEYQHSQETLAMLEQLDGLHKAGILTDEEFAAKKAELLRRV